MREPKSPSMFVVDIAAVVFAEYVGTDLDGHHVVIVDINGSTTQRELRFPHSTAAMDFMRLVARYTNNNISYCIPKAANGYTVWQNL